MAYISSSQAMKHAMFLFLLTHSLIAQGQFERYPDSLLLDAQFDKVIQWADQEGRSTEANSSRNVIVTTRKAEALVRLGKYEDAERVLASVPGDHLNAAEKSTVNIGYGSLYLNQGLYDQAEQRLESALNQLEESGKGNGFEAVQALSYLGNLRRATGEYAKAEELLTRSLNLREQMFDNQSEWIAASYNDLGLVYGQTDPDKALDYYERALRIYEKLHPHTHPKIAIALTNIGFAYSAIELYGDAINNFESALKIWEGIYPGAHSTKAFLNLSLGEIYRKLKKPEVATAYYEKALLLYKESYGKKHPDLAAAYNALGNLLLEQRNHEDALDAYQHALASNIVNFDDLDVNHMPGMKGYYNGRTLLNTMLFKSQALEARYFARTIRLDDLVAARDALMSCDTLVDRLRQQITNENDKLALSAIAAQVYQSGVRVCVEAAEVALHKTSWNERAFFFAEKGKSATLLEGISDVHAKSFARIPLRLLEEEKQLRAGLALATAQLAQKPSPADEQRLRERLFLLNRQYEQFVARLEKDFPQYYNLKFNTVPPRLVDVQHKLDDKTAILSYLIDEDHSGLYVFVITKKKYRVFQQPLPADLDRNITGLRNGLVFNTPAVYRSAATSLSKSLLPKIPGGIEDLVIIPTGRLSVVPFETLFTNTRKNGEDLPYLVKDYSIRYEFTASLILQKAAPSAAQKAILLCAPITFSEHELADLPGTESELEAMASLFSSHQYTRTVLKKEKADEQSLLQQPLNRFQYLHIATHGVVDESHPELSRLYLKRNAGNDGLLYAGEIYNLELNADLVTLSACQTGLGKISKGEGVIGLSRALAYAGARRMVVSFWRVADESTSLLMQDFYTMLLSDQGASPARHLRNAKLHMISSAKFASPYYWAPFVMIGF